MKLIDAKIGEEVSAKLFMLVGAVANLTANIHSVAEKVIASNEKLSKSNEKYTKALCWFTGGLVFVGFLQFLALIIPLFKK